MTLTSQVQDLLGQFNFSSAAVLSPTLTKFAETVNSIQREIEPLAQLVDSEAAAKALVDAAMGTVSAASELINAAKST
jgi:septation ring formation regulator EzrA